MIDRLHHARLAHASAIAAASELTVEEQTLVMWELVALGNAVRREEAKAFGDEGDE